jgi:hypothetical protein
MNRIYQIGMYQIGMFNELYFVKHHINRNMRFMLQAGSYCKPIVNYDNLTIEGKNG